MRKRRKKNWESVFSTTEDRTMLRNMPPPSAMNYELYCSLAHAELPSQCVHRGTISPPDAPNLRNLSLIEFRASLSATAHSVEPTLPHTVPHVVQMSACEKVSRIARGPIITVMTDLIALWNRVAGIKPRETVSHLWIWALSVFVWMFRMWREATVAVMRPVSNPRPAFIWPATLDLFPKSLLGRGFNCHLGYVT